VFVYVLHKIDFSPQPLLIMWKTSGVTYGRMVNNLSGPVEKPRQGRVLGCHSGLRIPGSFHRNMLMAGLNGLKTCRDTVSCPKSSARATFRDVMLGTSF